MILQPRDYINLKITGQFSGDFWTSKGLVSLDSSKRTKPLRALGLFEELFPPCTEDNQVLGFITPQAQGSVGLPHGIPEMAGWSDTLGAVLSLGLCSGEAFVLSGTSDSIGMLIPHQHISAPEVLVAPVWDSGWDIVYGPMSTGMATITWASAGLGFAQNYELVEASTRGRSDDAPVFIPYLGGQRSPIWDDRVRAMFARVAFHTTREQLAYSVVEGVIWSEFDVLVAVEKALNTRSERVVATGGGAWIPFYNEVRSAMNDRGIEVSDADPVLGAALLAYWGLILGNFLGFRPPWKSCARL